MNRRGFTIVELVIVIAIMAVLLTLGVVNVRASQIDARDAERKTDIETIAQHLETFYTSGADDNTTKVDCTGGSIKHDGLYTIHTFTSDGTFLCSMNITAEVLVVAGGGAGSIDHGGGGGGGGLLYSNNYAVVANTPITVEVGAGGQAVTGSHLGITSPSPLNNQTGTTVRPYGAADVGEKSSFGSAYANGGGGGSGFGYGSGGGPGGSGGGAGAQSSAAGGAATQTNSGGMTGYGNAGGGNSAGTDAGGGGGGAGSAGTNGTGASSPAANGGNGRLYSISGTSTYYAGGGGGGSHTSGLYGIGGLGGGGDGIGQNGQPNTGGGGGGIYNDLNLKAGDGGSGIVIVKYISPIATGTYPPTTFTSATAWTTLSLRDIDIDSLKAPGISDPTDSFIPATDATILTSASAHPTTSEYVYQPIHSDGSLCNDAFECRKFNLYYRLESDNAVYMVRSVNR
jgi:prepilin-type N-terminal cleavage/methylation domain-containing protein